MTGKGLNRLLFDTNVLIDALAHKEIASLHLFQSKGIEMFTNDYALKEFRRILTKKGYSAGRINEFIDYIRDRCTVLPTPSKEEFARYRLTDRSDRPLLASAVKAGCILVTHDTLLLKEAQQYVEALTAAEVLDLWRRQAAP